MENVLAAFITIFLFLFSALTISRTILSSEAATRSAWQTMQTRAETKARTHLSPTSALSVKALSTDPLATFNFAYRNDGDIKLSDFADWDVFVEYTDGSTPPGHHINRLTLDDNPGALLDSWWKVESIYSVYLDTPVQHHVAEVIEPHVVNPGEVLVIQIALNPPAQPGATLQVTLATPNGVSTATQFTPDTAPVLVANTGLTAARDGSTPIDRTQLSATDADDTPGNVVYTVMIPPQHGTLSLGNTFTQFAIDNALLQYKHTGTGPDSFSFTITDGKTVIGPLTFVIKISEPPSALTHTGITAAVHQEVVIDGNVLSATDTDNAPEDLIYTITQPPTHGTLNLGHTFTQAAVNSGALTYTRDTTGPDGFAFTVTDGQTVSDPLLFTIAEP